MHIALLASAANIHTVRWATAIARRGISVTLYSQHGPAAPELEQAGVKVQMLPHRAMLGYARNAIALRAFYKTAGADFLHVHYVGGYGLTALLSGIRPLMMSVWGADVYDVPERSPVHRWLVRTILNRARLISSTSEVMAHQTLRLGVTRPIEVVPFGVETERFSPRTSKEPAQPATIGTIKTLHPKYGIDTLIEAFAILSKAEISNATLRVVGPGDYTEAYKTLAADLGISDRCAFVGPVPHSSVPEELRRLDIFVAASRLDSESFGVAVIEASSCGVPVVVSDAGGLPEVVKDEITGLIVPRENPQQLAEALKRLVADPVLRDRMGLAGRQLVRAKYEWEVCVDAMLRCYARMIVPA
jgi:glycosyltransferase involved in cell wall biosynthesis